MGDLNDSMMDQDILATLLPIATHALVLVGYQRGHRTMGVWKFNG